jgi:hypothetical protein
MMQTILLRLLGIVALFSVGGFFIIIGLAEMLLWAIPTDTAWMDVVILLTLGFIALIAGIIGYYELDKLQIMEVEFDIEDDSRMRDE